MDTEPTYSAFAGPRRIAGGNLREVLLATKAYLDRGGRGTLLIFEGWSGRQVDFDFRGTPEEVVERAAPTHPGPGRPRLGVISREVTLLPRHWDWLEQQPSGISAALRRLVDQARKRDPAGETARLAREAASRFMSAIAGDLPGFEEASRALFAGDQKGLDRLMRRWPKDVREHVRHLVRAAA